MSNRAFVNASQPARVVFGCGATARLHEGGVNMAADSARANFNRNPRPLAGDAIAALAACTHAGERPLVEWRIST